MNAAILVINTGSSSLKFAVYADGATLDLFEKGEGVPSEHFHRAVVRPIAALSLPRRNGVWGAMER